MSAPVPAPVLGDSIPSAGIRAGRLIAFAMILVTFGLALAMHLAGRASVLEAASFVTGAVCVWLTVRESVWNFPISLVNVTTFAVVYFRAALFADAGLQVVYFVLTAIGWYLWCCGGANRTPLRIKRASSRELGIVVACGALLAVCLWWLLGRVGGASPVWDGTTTALSLCAQWLLNRKRIENWWFWIAADLIYVPLYAWKGLYLTSVLYGVFLCMCIVGVTQWRASMAQPAGQR
jgi:nicotinamide mononucleotide transporter